jgi:hypothetical protein
VDADLHARRAVIRITVAKTARSRGILVPVFTPLEANSPISIEVRGQLGVAVMNAGEDRHPSVHPAGGNGDPTWWWSIRHFEITDVARIRDNETISVAGPEAGF